MNCVLALKSYNEWKQTGQKGVWKFGGNVKPATAISGKQFSMKNPQPFMNSLSRTLSMNEKSTDSEIYDLGSNKKVGELIWSSFSFKS